MLSSHNTKLKREISKFLKLIFRDSDNSFINELVLDRLLWTATEDDDDTIHADPKKLRCVEVAVGIDRFSTAKYRSTGLHLVGR